MEIELSIPLQHGKERGWKIVVKLHFSIGFL